MFDLNAAMFYAKHRHEELISAAQHEAFLARNGLRVNVFGQLINALRGVFATRTAPAVKTAARPLVAK